MTVASGSLTVNVTVGVVSTVIGCGPPVISTTGLAVSTVNSMVAGTALLPDSSSALITIVCGPSSRAPVVTDGGAHGTSGWPSSVHVTSDGSDTLNSTVASSSPIAAAGADVTVMTGLVVSGS